MELRKTKTFAIMANDYYDYDKLDNRFKLKDIHNLRCSQSALHIIYANLGRCELS